jgi:hypothetical protein
MSSSAYRALTFSAYCKYFAVRGLSGSQAVRGKWSTPKPNSRYATGIVRRRCLSGSYGFGPMSLPHGVE